MAKIVQIMARGDALYALDSDGRIWMTTFENFRAVEWQRVVGPDACVGDDETKRVAQQMSCDHVWHGPEQGCRKCGAPLPATRTDEMAAEIERWERVYRTITDEEKRAAVRTLRRMGYTYPGGLLWSPPLGER
jgi:hypothetical protein